MAFALTRRQRDCLDFVRRYIASTGRGPTVEEIAGEIGIKSKSGAHRLLTSLVERGHINRLDHRPRALELADVSGAAPAVTTVHAAAGALAPIVTVIVDHEGKLKRVRVDGDVRVRKEIE